LPVFFPSSLGRRPLEGLPAPVASVSYRRGSDCGLSHHLPVVEARRDGNIAVTRTWTLRSTICLPPVVILPPTLEPQPARVCAFAIYRTRAFSRCRWKNVAPPAARSRPPTRFTHVVEMFTYQDSKRQLSNRLDGLREIHCQVRRRYLLLKTSGSGVPAQHVTHPIKQRTAGKSSRILASRALQGRAPVSEHEWTGTICPKYVTRRSSATTRVAITSASPKQGTVRYPTLEADLRNDSRYSRNTTRRMSTRLRSGYNYNVMLCTHRAGC
jgi:hypothetical protein